MGTVYRISMIRVRWVVSRRVLILDGVLTRTARADSGNSDSPDREIRLVKNPDGQWTARDLRIGVTAQGNSRDAALDNLDGVIEAVGNDSGRSPTDEEIRDLGVDPEVAWSQSDELPDIL